MPTMQEKADHKALLKILIGVAWIDGRVQTQEQDYLLQLAQKQGLADDTDLKPWLYGLRSVSMQECYRWIEDYLGQHPSPEDGNNLIEAVSGLIYSDGEVASEEAKLVSRLLTANTHAKAHSIHDSLLKAVQHLYQRWRQRVCGES
jgi:uncharacterized tellurite resistance protein B-like protein